jgi:glycosyltransferase involved in cell wall biosynthesis
MAAGLPVVTTMQRGYRRYFGEGDVVAVDADAGSIRRALLHLAHDPHQRERLSARSLEVAGRHFGAPAFLDAYERIYQAISQH